MNHTLSYPPITRVEASWPGPLVVRPASLLSSWARDNRAWVDRALVEHGAILFRGCDIDSPAAFREAAAMMCDHLLDYVYRSTPRTAIDQHVYTATEYRADARIPMHNENSYQRDWPTKLLFCCTQPAERGGETPLALTAAVTRRIDAEIVRTFQRRGVTYVRNYGHGVDLPWQTTFQTESRDDVEAFCLAHDITWEWFSDGQLRTRQVCHAVARHPVTSDLLWFNQAHLFHPSSLGSDDREVLLELFGESNLPRHAYFGDGAPLDDTALDHIRQAYDAEAVTFLWEKGDVLLLDNMLVCHGRMPYTGPRQVLVAMGDPVNDRPTP